ncbi:enoyl-CoA hydratase/isomerase family protein [Amorphus sp. 3PC139-8]|uniref:enoyl-CoA hydratase/isomerase family protein n=1 Tax=Amorphus sp. 3PC139-8 TaxID=2735676 RepID=UPI00345D2758
MCVRVEQEGAVAWVIIDRPARRNAIDIETHEALRALWPRLEADASVRVIVLTGAGEQAFCAGADIGSFLPWLAERIAAGEDPGDFCGLTHRALSKPVIAGINGAAVGGGLELALAADLRIAADHAVFGLPEVGLGAIAGAGGVVRLSRMIPHAIAADMILTGRSIDARRALEVGLISEIVPGPQLREAVGRVAARVAANSPTALRLSARVMRETAGLPLDTALAAERTAFRESTASEDYSIGLRSFAEKRRPEFTGR